MLHGQGLSIRLDVAVSVELEQRAHRDLCRSLALLLGRVPTAGDLPKQFLRLRAGLIDVHLGEGTQPHQLDLALHALLHVEDLSASARHVQAQALGPCVGVDRPLAFSRAQRRDGSLGESQLVRHL